MSSLRGKVVFAEEQVHAQITAPLAQLLSRWVSNRFPRPVLEEMRVALEQATRHFSGAGPKIVVPSSEERLCIVFVDGACEDAVSVGSFLLA